MNAQPSIVHFDRVAMRYGNGPDVLEDVSFSLPQGSFHFLTGESGAGKTSLLRLIYLAGKPSSGRVEVFGHDVENLERADIPNIRRHVGVVFQDFRLLDHMSALENVALPLRVGGAKGQRVRQHVSELMRWVGLAEQMDARPSTLSGGEQQRIAIARAVINRPSLLLADEPTGNVDDRMGMRLLYLFEELNRMGTTVLIATHNDALVRRFNYPEIRLADGGLVMA